MTKSTNKVCYSGELIYDGKNYVREKCDCSQLKQELEKIKKQNLEYKEFVAKIFSLDVTRLHIKYLDFEYPEEEELEGNDK